MTARFISAALLTALTPLACAAQPAENPCESAAHEARIGPENGRRIVIHGQVLRSDGSAPASGVTVYSYQTGAEGLYREGENGVPRLHAFMKTDDEGRFRLETIRPGHYPEGGIPSHLHFQFWSDDAPPQWADEIWFSDDPVAEKVAQQGGDYFEIISLTGDPPSGEVIFTLKSKRDGFQESIQHGLRACGML